MSTIIPLVNGTTIKFSISFDAPLNYSVYKTFKVVDTLAAGFSLDINNTFVKLDEVVIPNWNLNYNEETREIVININNSNENAGRHIEIIIATKLIDKSQIESYLMLVNTAYVEINGILGLTTASEEVRVNFSEIAENEIIIIPESQNQIILLIEGDKIGFSTLFQWTTYDEEHSMYNVITTLPEGLTFIEADSSVTLSENINSFTRAIRNYEQPIIDVEYNYDSNSRRLSINITNSPQFLGRQIVVKIGSQITNKQIEKDQVKFDVELGFNNDQEKIVSTNTITIDFIEPIKITASVNNPTQKLENGINIVYTGKFTVPENSKNIIYNTFTIQDILPDGLAFDINKSSIILSDETEFNGNIKYPEDGEIGLINIVFNNYSEIQGKDIFVNISTKLIDKDKIPPNLTISNSISLIINGDYATKVNSENVIVKFISQSKEEALNNLIESIAMIENQLANVINAESGVLGRVITIAKNQEEIVKFNNSMKRMMNEINILEQLLVKQLKKANI